jgi:hypothetical protein
VFLRMCMQLTLLGCFALQPGVADTFEITLASGSESKAFFEDGNLEINQLIGSYGVTGSLSRDAGRFNATGISIECLSTTSNCGGITLGWAYGSIYSAPVTLTFSVAASGYTVGYVSGSITHMDLWGSVHRAPSWDIYGPPPESGEAPEQREFSYSADPWVLQIPEGYFGQISSTGYLSVYAMGPGSKLVLPGSIDTAITVASVPEPTSSLLLMTVALLLLGTLRQCRTI